MSKKLFRDHAVDAQKSKWIGEVILIRPFSFTVLTTCVAIIAIMIILFLFLGTYTKRTTVQGQLIPNTGLIRLFTVEGGTVEKILIKDGQHVQKDQPLYELKMTRYSPNGNYNDSVEQQIQLKKQSFETEKEKLTDLHQHSYDQTLAEMSASQQDISRIKELILQQQRRVALASENVNRYQGLKDQDYISVEEFQSKQDLYLNQKLALENYQRDLIDKQSNLTHQNISLKSFSSKLQNELTGVDRQIASNQQEFIENRARDRLILRANSAGTVSSINAQIGQQINANIPLLNIVPDGSSLEAHLYIPSSAIGFIRLNQPVKLRFQAFPYQKFGQADGKILSISETTINPQELSSFGDVNQSFKNNQNDPIYLVKVRLNEQTIKAYGEKKPLKVGMVFEADILQEQRKLYEWVLEPLYSISGKL
mgnify:CR=1 FL=1